MISSLFLLSNSAMPRHSSECLSIRNERHCLASRNLTISVFVSALVLICPKTIHEMIHYYIHFNGIKDTSAHGKVFRQMMNDINQRFGRNITITHKSTPEQKQQLANSRKSWHVVAVVKFHDGRSGIKVLPRIRQRIIAYRNGVLMSREIKSVDFYITNDPYFNAYPNSSALKVHILDTSEYEPHLQRQLSEKVLAINS